MALGQGPTVEVEAVERIALAADVREDAFAQEAMTPSRGYSQQPASVETAVPAWLSSPQRYRAAAAAPQAMVQASPNRSDIPGSISASVPMLPAVPLTSEGFAQLPTTAPGTSVAMEMVQERVQVPRQVVRSPDLMVRDNGLNGTVGRTGVVQLPSSVAPFEVRRATSPMPSVMETVVREPVPAQITVVEKVVEQQGMSAQEMQMWLQSERSRLSGAMQEIMAQHSKTLAEVINEEVHKVIHMVNAVSNSCEERLVRLEADRSARSTVFQGLKRDVDGLQAQIADLEQFRTIGSCAKDQAGKEREEVLAVLETVTKDIRNQHRSVLSGLTVQKELQQKLEQALVEVRGDIEALAGEASNQRTALCGLSSQKDMLILQKDQQTIDKAIVELRRQTVQSLEVVRTEFSNEVTTMRQTHLSGLSERLSALEQRRVDQDLQELTRLIHTERSGRNDLAQTLESYRTTHLQTCTELRGEIDSWSEKLSRLEMAVVEERGARERTMMLEQNVNEVRNIVNRRCGDIEAKLDAAAYVGKDVQELKKVISIEQSERSDLTQSFDTQRKASQQMVSDLRTEVERSLQEVRKVTSAPSEDKNSRERCGVLEKTSQDLRSIMTRRLTELTSRLDVLEGAGLVSKELEELSRQIRAENAARVDISQTLDAYRMAHLQTSTELRADLDVALEKLNKLDRPVIGSLGASTPSMLKPQGLQASRRLNAPASPGKSSLSSLAAGLASTYAGATDGVAEGVGFSMITAAPSEDTRVTPLRKVPDGASITDRIEEMREEVRLEVDTADVSAALLGGGLLGGGEGDAGGSLLGRGLTSAAALGAASDVAEVLADDRRLIGRGLRAAGNR